MNIFVVVGTQEPFDRLLKVIDMWSTTQKDVNIVAQIGDSNYEANQIKCFKYLPPLEFNQIFNDSDLIIAHAGMGTIISALENEKAILVMPRLVEFKEHRNDHQLSTAKSFEDLIGLNVAYNQKELTEKLERIDELVPLKKISRFASQSLIESLTNIIEDY